MEPALFEFNRVKRIQLNTQWQKGAAGAIFEFNRVNSGGPFIFSLGIMKSLIPLLPA
jgi:hypothetical protein